MYDVVIVGGGPAGLSAALVLGRCRRRVLVCDAGRPRNARSQEMHGYLTRDGIAPLDFLKLGREELWQYGIEPRHVTVTEVVPTPPTGFEVVLDNRERVRAATVLIATGVRDRLPDIDGLEDCYGISVHHCPYCDGWEVRDRALVVVADDDTSPAGLALSLLTWSERVTACTNGRATIRPAERRRLRARQIPVIDSPIAHVTHDDGHVTHLVFVNGDTVACDAIFFTTPQAQQCDLARNLGCELSKDGTVKTDLLGKTCVPGVYVVGDASRDVQFVVVAAAEGAKAGVAINKALSQGAR